MKLNGCDGVGSVVLAGRGLVVVGQGRRMDWRDWMDRMDGMDWMDGMDACGVVRRAGLPGMVGPEGDGRSVGCPTGERRAVKLARRGGVGGVVAVLPP